MGDDMTKVGVVGFGYWGPNHVRVLAGTPGVQVLVFDPDPAQRNRARHMFPDVLTFSSLSACSDRIDAVVVCSPPFSHLSVAEEAFTRGCHVLVEKPLALTSSDARAMVEMSETSGKTLMTGHIYDFHAATHWMENRAEERLYGSIRYIDAARLAVGGYRTDVNVMWDMAPHDLCLMRRVLGQWPSAVSAWAFDHSGQGVPDVALMRLEFPDTDAIGYIRVSWLDPVKVRRFTVVGDASMVVFNDSADPTKPLRVIETGATTSLGEGARHPVPGAYPDELIDDPVIEPVEPLVAELDHFLHCVRTGASPERASGVDGLEVVRILEAADRSAELGEAVPIPRLGETIAATR
jgi:predicted dehydrogenase